MVSARAKADGEPDVLSALAAQLSKKIDREELRELIDAMNKRGEREERLIRALEVIAQNQQRTLNHAENKRAKAQGRSGPTTQQDIDQVRARLAKRSSK